MKQLLSYLLLKPAPKPVDPNAPRYADVYGRAVAGALDLALIYYLIGWMFPIINGWLAPMLDVEMLATAKPEHYGEVISIAWHGGLIGFFMANCVIQFVIIGIYWVGCQAAFHTTPGKLLFGYSIVRNDDHSQRPTNSQYVWRYLAYLPSCAPLMLGLFFAMFRKDRRALHDRIAGTAVLSVRPKGWYWAKVKRLFAGKASSAPVE